MSLVVDKPLVVANPFHLKVDDYKRDINVIKQAVLQYAQYLHLRTEKPLEYCHRYVRKQLEPGGRYEFRDPIVKLLERGSNGDREITEMKLSKYLQEVIDGDLLIAPTMTVYLPRHVSKSLLVDFIDENIAKRNKNKKLKFKAKMAGNKVEAGIMDNRQNNNKTSNNSMSGGHVSYSTPLANKTAHSTLTSTCRTTSGYGNANNEKLLDGNRHYHDPDIVRNNIVSIVFNSDYPAIRHAIEKYDLRYPTEAETMACITHSTNLYWPMSVRLREDFEATVNRLTPIQRAAFVYTGDMYHLMKLNDEPIRLFVARLSYSVDQPHPDPDSVMQALPETTRHLATQLCERFMKGKEIDIHAGTVTYENKVLDAVKFREEYAIVANTMVNINDTIAEYTDLIKAFWVTPNVPASLAHFPDSIRRSALMSDTDSTIFTVQDWVMWHNNGSYVGPKANAVAATMIFLASQTITHVLARMSVNMGIERSRLFKIAMKNEYKFDVFIPTQVAKHYFALIGCQEGNLYEKYDMEIKGVHLKNSNVSKAIMKQAENMMRGIMETVVAGEFIDLRAILKEIADTERSIVDSIRRGSHEYFKFINVKPLETYTKREDEPVYQSYLLWEEVFAPKYGSTIAPPYQAVRVSVDLEKGYQIAEWLAKMKDRDLADRMKAWLDKKDRKGLTTFNLPEQIIAANGIPEEIFEMINTRKIILAMTTVFYIILETLGVYYLNGASTRLVSDEH